MTIEYKGTTNMRKFLCSGYGLAKGYEYQVEARFHNTAKSKAAQLFKESTQRPEPLEFLKLWFESRVLDPRKPGPVPSLLNYSPKEVIR